MEQSRSLMFGYKESAGSSLPSIMSTHGAKGALNHYTFNPNIAKDFLAGVLDSRGCQNGAFGNLSFCLSDTCHFDFRRFPGSEEQSPSFSWVECNIRMFAAFRQNHLFSAGDRKTKTTVSTSLSLSRCRFACGISLKGSTKN